MILAKLLVALGLDVSEYNKGLEGAETKASSSAAAIGKNLSNIGAGMQKTGAIMSAAVTAPVILFMNKAINAASDLDETMNKTRVVFEGSADAVLAFAQNSATAMGMSTEQTLSAAATYGNMFTAMGIVESKSADMSTSLVQLASDLASFNNADPSEVMESIRSALAGQPESMRKFGVNINEVTLKAKALELGLSDGKSVLDAGTKAQAAYALMLEQTSKAQGDFARTSDGLANSQRIVAAQYENMAATVGKQLLPIKLKLITVLSNVMTIFTNMSPKTQKVVLVIMGLAAAIGPLLMVLGTLVSAVGTLMPIFGAIAAVITGPVALAIGIVIAAVALLYAAWKNNWFGIRDTVQKVIDWMRPFIEGAFLKIKNFMQGISDGISKAMDWLGIAANKAAKEQEELAKRTEELSNISHATPPNIRALNKSLEENATAADTAAKANNSIAYAIQGVEKATLAREAIGALHQAYVDKLISLEEYRARTALIMTNWMGMPAAEVNAALALQDFKKQQEDGKITAMDYYNIIVGTKNTLEGMNGKRYTSYFEMVTTETNYHYTPPSTPAASTTTKTPWKPRFPGDVPPGGAYGLDEIVPAGYPNDTALYRATSGEHITITPRGGGATNEDIVAAIRALKLQIDEKSLARSIRDAVLQVVQ